MSKCVPFYHRSWVPGALQVGAQASNSQVQNLYLSPSAPSNPLADAQSAVETSSLGSPSPPWGLDMIDQRSLPLDHLYHWNALGGAETGVLALIIMQQILVQHDNSCTTPPAILVEQAWLHA